MSSINSETPFTSDRDFMPLGGGLGIRSSVKDDLSNDGSFSQFVSNCIQSEVVDQFLDVLLL